MIDRPLITVVTVCWNAAPALRATAESVLSQDLAGVEYLIVDGASTDGTSGVLDELTRRGARVVSEPDRGISDAINKSIRLASGRWIAHLHAGDTYLDGTISKVARLAAADRSDVICGHLVKVEPSGEVIYGCEPLRLDRDMTVNHPATWTRREVFEKIGDFDERLKNAQDYDFFLRAFLAGARFEVIPEPLARMIGGGQSERSIWRTLHESYMIRRAHLSGWRASYVFFLLQYLRASVRRLLQSLGLGGLVALYRRHFSLLPKRSS